MAVIIHWHGDDYGGGIVSLLFMALNLLWAVVMTCRRKGWFKIIVLVLCIGIYRFYLGEDTK